jgi:hypothetical protein
MDDPESTGFSARIAAVPEFIGVGQRLITAVLAFAFALAATGCGAGSDPAGAGATSSDSTEADRVEQLLLD